MSNRPAECHKHGHDTTSECAASICGLQGAAFIDKRAFLWLLMQRASPEDSPCKIDRWMGAHESRSRSLMPACPSSVLYRDCTYKLLFFLYELASTLYTM